MNRLCELRTEKALSQRQIAEQFSVSQGTYNNWENGRTQPSIEQLISLAKFFGVSVDYLVGNDDAVANVADNLSAEKLRLFRAVQRLDNRTATLFVELLERLNG